MLGHFHVCEFYTVNNPAGHCRLYGTGQRPKECTKFPRGPDDLDRVKQYCSIRFVDENGRVVDSWMDPNVRLTPVKKSS